MGGSGDVESTDGGKYPDLYEMGDSLALEPVDYNPSLAAYWKFNEGTGTTAYDFSGHGNNGTWSGTQSGGSGYYSPGKLWTCAGYWNGTDDYVNAGTPSQLRINQLGNQVTLSVWLNWEGNPSGLEYIGGFNGYFGDYEIWISASASSTYTILFEVDGQYGNSLATSGAISENSWHHIAATFNQSSMIIYVDGAEIASKSSPYFPPTDGSSNLEFGESYAYYFHGLMNDYRIYNHTLTASQIQAIYNAEK